MKKEKRDWNSVRMNEGRKEKLKQLLGGRLKKNETVREERDDVCSRSFEYYLTCMQSMYTPVHDCCLRNPVQLSLELCCFCRNGKA